MYRHQTRSWTKHLDFIVIDLLCLQLAFVLSFWLNVRVGNPYSAHSSGTQYQIVVLTLSQLVVILFTNAYGGILRRGPLAEAGAVLKFAGLVLVVAVAYLFVVHHTMNVSRLLFGFTLMFYVMLSYAFRQLNKMRVLRSGGGRRRKSMILVTSSDFIVPAMDRLLGGEGYKDFFVSGILLFDEPEGMFPNYGVPVELLTAESLLEVSRGWVDEALVLKPDGMAVPLDLIDDLVDMGVTVNYTPTASINGRWPAMEMREIGDIRVFTVGARFATIGQAALKRIADIAGGIVGCIVTAVLFVFIAPAIYVKSPGPIFFAQERIGRNGRSFKMYKFRSMYPDAEERKAELAARNKVGDGMMFKVDGDPRIIGSEKRRRDGSPGGIGNFIRRTSIDEFPQFFNVLKGDMSLVGTRPPTVDEWERYSLWHRSRMSVKPGITGMWQVSGRSTITDFDEVVRLDRQYIDEWSPLLDIKILLKTVVVVFKRSGAE